MSKNQNWFISDLDGTLLSDFGVLTNFSKDKLTALLEKGFLFSVASARSLYRIKEVLGDLPLSLPVIQLNGGIVNDYKSEKLLRVADIEKSLVVDIFSILNEMQVQFVATGIMDSSGKKDFCLVPERQNEPLRDFYEDRMKKKDRRLMVGEASKVLANECVVSLTVCDAREKVKQVLPILQEKFGSQIDICPMGMPTNEWMWCTVQSRHATKGEALDFVASHCGLDTGRATVFGDELNDLPMFEKAGYSVAPGNAILKLKESADKIIGLHNQDSVAKYLWDEAR